jgi:hypothetical protein
MKDLIDYQRFQVEALQKRICELEKNLNEVKTYVFELCEDDCPEEYKTIIKQQIYNLEK